MLFDKQFVIESLEGDEEIFDLLAKEYIDTCDDHIKRIIAAVNSGVFEEIHLEIHSLKGTFQTYGLKEDYINWLCAN